MQIVDLPVDAANDVTNLQGVGQRAAFLDTKNKIRDYSNGTLIGTLDAHAMEALSKIAIDGQIELQLSYVKPQESHEKHRRRDANYLDIILYGPKIRADDLGEFVAKCGYYLQEPSGCNRNVPYCNPQCLSSLYDNPRLTFDLHNEKHHQAKDFAGDIKDFMNSFETTELVIEEQTPCALATPLHA